MKTSNLIPSFILAFIITPFLMVAFSFIMLIALPIFFIEWLFFHRKTTSFNDFVFYILDEIFKIQEDIPRWKRQQN